MDALREQVAAALAKHRPDAVLSQGDTGSVVATPNVRRLPPLDHRELLWLLRRCRFAITDSGGIQEEAPSVGVPVLVTRRTTERPEAMEHGWAKLLGWHPEQIERSDRRTQRPFPTCTW